MRRSTLLFALAAYAGATSALAQTSSPPRNDLPQPYRTTRDWGELPAGMKWAAVTSIEAAADGSIFVIHRCAANSCAGRPEPPILKFDPNGKLGKVFAFIEDMESTTPDHSGAEGIGEDAQGNVYGAVVRRQMLERHVKK